MVQKKYNINQIEPLISKDDKSEIIKYVNSGGWITEHKKNKIFEEQFKKITNSKNAITFPNGTLTIVSILLALDIKKNDEVIVPNYTMVATANAIKLIGARPILCDISKNDLCLDPIKLNKKINKKTKAVIYVTLNGRSGQIDKIQNICKKKKIFLIEDSAHSIGSYYKKKHHGNFSIASSFSFSMPKIITTGQGGMVISNNKQLSKKLRLIKNFGRTSDGNDKYESVGFNFKFTDLQSVLGISQLKNIKKKILKKKNIYKKYYSKLKQLENKKIEFFNFKNYETPWFVDIYVSKPQLLQKYLLKNGIKTRLVYPSLNKLKIFNQKGDFKISNYYCSRGLWLPSSLNLTNDQINFISKKIIDFFDNKITKVK